MKKLLTAIALIGILLTGVAKSQNRQEPIGNPDAKDLQGEWQAVDRQRNGQSEERFVKALKNSRWIFQGEQAIGFTFSAGNLMPPRGRRKWLFTLDPTKQPKEIDVVITRLDEDATVPGIYSLERGRLTICQNPERKRPTDFKTADGDGNVLEVYERVGMDPTATLDFAKIQNDFEEVSWTWWEALGKARTGEEKRRLKAERVQTYELFANRYLKFAQTHPDGFAGLAALCRAAFLAPASASGTKALAVLEDGRVAQADLNELKRALITARNSSAEKAGQEALAPQVLACVRRQLDHPDAAQMLAWIATSCAGDQSTNETFAEAADLIVGRFAGSPDIFNFCEIVDTQNSNPVWGTKVEKYLRTILDQNTDRFVRSCASFALASAVQNAGEARQDEAERLFRQFITDFTENADGPQQFQLARAKAEIEEIRSRGVGKPAPELVGEDLDGRPMKLADFRGKVVLVSFWATWCGPCMQMVPHERFLVKRLQNKPFALVGVNGDIEPEELRKGIEKHEITWRSFKNKLDDKTAISEQWKIPGWPTFYLIDQNGIVRKRWTDTVPPEVLNREVDDLIATSASDTSQAR
jgi:uncharacterized protein (TIGR03067 family)